MMKRLLIIACFLGFAATALSTNSGCTRKVYVEHDHDHGHWHH